MIAQAIYIIAMTAFIVWFSKRSTFFDIYTREEWAYHEYQVFMARVEPRIAKRRLEEIRNGCW